MKRFKILIFAAMSLLISTSALAGSCEIPKFLKKGMMIGFYVGMWEETAVKVIEIDKKTCWIKIDNENYPWVNLNTIAAIKPVKE